MAGAPLFKSSLDIKADAFMKWLAGLLEGSLSPELTVKVLAAALAGIPLLYFLGAICWLFIDPVTPLEKPRKA